MLFDLMTTVKEANPDWEIYLISGSAGPLVDLCKEAGVRARVLELPSELARLGDAGAGGPSGTEIGKLKLLRDMWRAGLATPAFIKTLRRQIIELKPDIVHSNGFKTHLLAAWSVPRPIPILWHVHDYVSARPVMARLLPLFARRCAAAVANSSSVAEDVRSVCPNLSIQYVHNGVDLQRFSSEGAVADLDELVGSPPASNGTIKVGLIATMARWKGHETFLRALSYLPASSRIRAYVVGGSLYQTRGSQYTLHELREIASRLGVVSKVGFTGYLADPAAAIRALDIVVHASTRPEPFGLAIAEAMACGKPVITSAVGGAQEVASVGETALWFAPDDAGKLAEQIATLAGDPQMRLQFGRAARLRAESRFNRRVLASVFGPIYQNMRAAAA